MAAPIKVGLTAVKHSCIQTMRHCCYWQAHSRRIAPITNVATLQKAQKQHTGQFSGHSQGQLRSMCYSEHQAEIASSKHMLMFDTHALVKKLIYSGFSSNQAESVVHALVQITEATLDHMNKNMVTKAQQEIMSQQLMSHMSSLRKDMIILEKSEFSALKHEYEKQNIEIKQIKQHFEDELTKLKSGVVLDLNLERSRAKEAHAENEQKLSHLVNRLDMGRTESEKHLSVIDNKIDKEIANLLATYERYRNDIMKYSAGTVLTCLTLCLGFFRLWS